jgi:hypothetical protein
VPPTIFRFVVAGGGGQIQKVYFSFLKEFLKKSTSSLRPCSDTHGKESVDDVINLEKDRVAGLYILAISFTFDLRVIS